MEADGYFSGKKILYNSNSNAYMLVYRIVNEEEFKKS